ncbi:MAG: helix-turn-helix domain-containing protein [Leeuwenhoekiella sp.]
MVNSKEFGKRLEKIMDFYELTASAFADQIDVGRSSISHILSGRNKPSLDFVMKIIERFDEVELYWLLNGKGTFPRSQKNVAIQSREHNNPGLFDTDSDAETKSATTENPDIPEKVNTSKNEKNISRIVIFYTDGSFDNFIN